MCVSELYRNGSFLNFFGPLEKSFNILKFFQKLFADLVSKCYIFWNNLVYWESFWPNFASLAKIEWLLKNTISVTLLHFSEAPKILNCPNSVSNCRRIVWHFWKCNAHKRIFALSLKFLFSVSTCACMVDQRLCYVRVTRWWNSNNITVKITIYSQRVTNLASKKISLTSLK